MMPVVRRGSDRTSFGRKLELDLAGWQADRHVEQFGLKHVRVLTVAPSKARVETMLEAQKTMTDGKGSRFFL